MIQMEEDDDVTIIEERDDIEAILAKYKIHTPQDNSEEPNAGCEILINSSPTKTFRNTIEEFPLTDIQEDNDVVIAGISGGSQESELKIKKTIRKKGNAKKDSENGKLDKQLQKETKQKEKEQKKMEEQRLKEIKKAIQLSNKRAKPEEAVKFITANIDHRLLDLAFGPGIVKAVENLGSSWKRVSQLAQRAITWSRRTDAYFLDEEGRLVGNSNVEEVSDVLLLREYEECVEAAREGELVLKIKEIQTMFGVRGERRITLGIYRGENQKFKKEDAKLLELALTELQILCNCCHRFLESGEDIAAMVAQFSKSIAQIPYKLEKQEKHMQAERYMSGDNRDCVRVDKDGNGLRRLWQQQLTSFPLARVETAEAIMSRYPTLKSLMQAYDECIDEDSREKLLQDIPIRRAAGPIVNVRKIGPELSKKMAMFYSSKSAVSIL